ncbi:MAG TPA: KTSC domain-containing protein [Allosphingosinicella sp.]
MPRVHSSAVDRVEYRAGERVLDIWYRDNGRYSYFGVPEALYRALLAAPSVGQFVNARIKDHFPFALEPGRGRFRPD